LALVMPSKRTTAALEAMFGPLEIRVLDALWARARAACVRDLQPEFPDIAYTTLMTTLDRLFRKGTLSRSKSGRAFYYMPNASRHQLILSMFVDTLEHHDEALLDELEALVRTRREELKGRDPR
jgi:predicted transcriptional regulator